jgi:hypothetical protein
MTKEDNIKAFYANKWAEKKRQERKVMGSSMALRRHDSLSLRIWENMVGRINNEYRKKNIIRNISYENLIGCNDQELLIHLAKTLPIGMTLEDYPKWVPDHKIPISSFDLKNDEQALTCFNFMNLQSLTEKENWNKNSKLVA